MRTLARIFIVLFCIVFLANHAPAVETKFLQGLLAKTVTYAVRGVSYAIVKADASERIGVLVDARLQAVEDHLEQTTGYKRPDVSEKAAASMGAMMVVETNKKKFEAAQAELFDMLKQD